MVEDLIQTIGLVQNLGVGIVALVIFYFFAEKYRKDFFNQLDLANKRAEESQQRFMTFIENSYKDNTSVLTELLDEFKEHTKMKDTAIIMLEKRHDELKKEFEEKYEYLRKYHES